MIPLTIPAYLSILMPGTELHERPLGCIVHIPTGYLMHANAQQAKLHQHAAHSLYENSTPLKQRFG